MVEGNGLENRRTRKGTVSSNLSPSAKNIQRKLDVFVFRREQVLALRFSRKTKKRPLKVVFLCLQSREVIRNLLR